MLGKPDVPSPRPSPTYLGTFDSCMVDVRICWSSWWESECSLLMMMMCLLMNTYTVKLNWNGWVIVHVNALVDACRQLCVRMLRFLLFSVSRTNLVSCGYVHIWWWFLSSFGLPVSVQHLKIMIPETVSECITISNIDTLPMRRLTLRHIHREVGVEQISWTK